MSFEDDFSTCFHFSPALTHAAGSQQPLNIPFSTNENWDFLSSNFSDIVSDAKDNYTLIHDSDFFDHEAQGEEFITKKFKADDLLERQVRQHDHDGYVSDSSAKTRSRKGKKYQVFNEEEKLEILTYLKKNGVKKTIETFSTNARRLTQRKLRCWNESQRKVKEHKGRKLENPAFDQAFLGWCFAFQQESGRAPNKNEARLKALRMSEAASFKASKGWLRRFSVRHNFIFSAVKDLKKPSEKRGKRASVLSASTTEALFHHPPENGPQIGDEFFNFDESCSNFESDNLHSPIRQDDLSLGSRLTKNDFGVYFFLKFDEQCTTDDPLWNRPDDNEIL